MDWKTKFIKYFWSIFGVLGVVLFWAGVWEGVGGLPYVVNPLVSLIVGLMMLSSSGLVIKEFGSEEGLSKRVELMRHISKHPLKHQFKVKYYDKIRRKHIHISVAGLHRVEKDLFLVLRDKTGENFIPIRRVKKVYHKGNEVKSVKHIKELTRKYH